MKKPSIKQFWMLLLCISSLNSQGQNKIFLKADYGYLYIPSIETKDISFIGYPVQTFYPTQPLIAILTEEFSRPVNLSGQLGVQKEVTPSLYLEFGLSYSWEQFQRKIKVDLPEHEVPMQTEVVPGVPGQPVYQYEGYYTDELYPYESGLQFITTDTNQVSSPTELRTPDKGLVKAGWLSIPLKINYAIISDRLLFGIGISPALMLHSSQVKDQINRIPEQASTGSPIRYWSPDEGTSETTISYLQLEEYVDRTGSGLNSYRFSGTAEAELRLLNNLWMDLSYSYCFTPIYTESAQYSGRAKMHTFRTGLRYYIAR